VPGCAPRLISRTGEQLVRKFQSFLNLTVTFVEEGLVTKEN
jgi:hypothetical protein